MDAQAQTVKAITDNIEAAYQGLRRTAQNISMLLSAGQATCQEVKAYNLYALSVYNTQRAMLTRMRAAGQTGIPELPPFPTLFAWKGVAGPDAFKVDCGKSGMAGVPFGTYSLAAPQLGSVLAEAMNSTRLQSPTYLSSDQINIITSDKQVAIREQDFPSLAQVTNAGLGLPPLAIIVVAAIAITVTVSAVVYSIMQYLTESKIQEETSARTKLQVQAYENYTATRAACFNDCVSRGNSVAGCVAQCGKLVKEPDIREMTGRGGAGGGMSTLETVGLATVAGIGGVVLFMLYRRRAQLARGFSSVRDVVSSDDDRDEVPVPRSPSRSRGMPPGRIIDVPST
jgi:hypothetical protein